MSCGGCHSNQEVTEVERKNIEIPKDAKVVTLTEHAAAKVKEFIKTDGKEGQKLRISVMPGGCAGYSYGMDFDQQKQDDIVIEEYGITLLVDPTSASHLLGTVIDFVDSLNESGFKINNPNAVESCGCGKSFI